MVARSILLAGVRGETFLPCCHQLISNPTEWAVRRHPCPGRPLCRILKGATARRDYRGGKFPIRGRARRHSAIRGEAPPRRLYVRVLDELIRLLLVPAVLLPRGAWSCPFRATQLRLSSSDLSPLSPTPPARSCRRRSDPARTSPESSSKAASPRPVLPGPSPRKAHLARPTQPIPSPRPSSPLRPRPLCLAQSTRLCRPRRPLTPSPGRPQRAGSAVRRFQVVAVAAGRADPDTLAAVLHRRSPESSSRRSSAAGRDDGSSALLAPYLSSS